MIPRCPKCQDAGYYVLDVPPDDPSFGTLIPCDCKDQELALKRKQLLLRSSNLEFLQHDTFSTFNYALDDLYPIYLAAHQFSRKPGGFLTLCGNTGSGKTHLAAAIANHLLDQGHDIYFSFVPDLLQDLLVQTQRPMEEGFIQHK